MRIHKIRILGDHDPLFRHGNQANNRVFRMIACRKIQRVRGIMSMFVEQGTKAAREMRIDQKFHVKAR